jgi:NADPH:quinone reductase-like Zn-dependent oxidoreductase
MSDRKPSGDGQMRAMVLHAFTGADRFQEERRERPVPAPTEVLVAVAATGINPIEWHASAGGWLATLHAGLPLHLGWDVAGRVVEVGYGVTQLRPGDDVFGLPRFPHPAGSYAEYVTAPARHFARKPAGITHIQAAGLPIAGLTAWQALIDVATVQAGHRVLVTAAAGGVGHLAVQIAKARGAVVIGTARRLNHPFLTELGVDRTVDYTEEDIATVGPVDVIIDLAGGSTLNTLPELLSPGGTLVSVTGELPPGVRDAARRRRADAVEILVEPDLAGLNGLAELVKRDELRVHVDAVFPLEEVAAAHDLGRKGHTRGKIILDVEATE